MNNNELFLIDAGLINQLLNYLTRQPYKDVHDLVQRLMILRVVEQQRPPMPSPEGVPIPEPSSTVQPEPAAAAPAATNGSRPPAKAKRR